MLHAEVERVLPVRDADPESLLDLGLVQNRVMRAGCLYRIIRRPARDYFAEVAGEVAYLAGKVVPAADSFVGVIVDACLAEVFRLQESQDELREVSGKSRCADLVGDYLEDWLLFAFPKDCLDKVLSVGTVEP